VNKYLIGISIAILSWLFGLLIRESYSFDTWRCLASLAVVDFLFMLVFCYGPVGNQRVRWCCSILTISMVSSLISSILFYMQHYSIISRESFIFSSVESIYPVLSLVLSALILCVMTLTDRMIEDVDDILWPRFARNFRYNFDVWRSNAFKKGAF